MAPRSSGTAARKAFEDRFVAEYLVDLNATQAYLRAKGKPVKENTAGTESWKLLKIPRIAAAVAAGQRKRLDAAELSAERVLEELRRLAFFDPADLFDDDGDLKPLREIPKEARAVIAGLEIARANFDKTDGKKSEEWLHKIKLANKGQALDLLAKHFKLVTEVVEVRGDWDKLTARIRTARSRAKKR